MVASLLSNFFVGVGTSSSLLGKSLISGFPLVPFPLLPFPCSSTAVPLKTTGVTSFVTGLGFKLVLTGSGGGDLK